MPHPSNDYSIMINWLGSTHRIFMSSQRTCLISPVADFFLVGGLSVFVILPLLFVDLPVSAAMAIVVPLAFIINDPHFIHSYQLMYERFWQKIGNSSLPASIRLRYIFAGIGVPALFLIWFIFCILKQSPEILAYTGNAMILMVGWHYAKQGYGMLIVLSALKKIYYTAWQKRIFLVNSYVVWITTWIMLNARIHELDMYAFIVRSFPMPVE